MPPSVITFTLWPADFPDPAIDSLTGIGILNEVPFLNVIEILRSHEQDIKGRFAVRRIGLFGSFVRGEETNDSDIDILVEFEDPTFRNFMNLAFFLEDPFGRRVDLLTPEGISHRIRPYVEKDVVWAD
ncbi:Nucleotidyltransferase domain protein [uncultured archaeon]|nr:Nucleotidyltransferase domain protein [uncultured archaeon]